MEQQQRSLIFTAAVGLIILAIIVGSIYYLVKFIQTRVASSRQTAQASVEVISQASASPEGSVQGQQAIQSSQITPEAQKTEPQGETKGGVAGAQATADQKIYNGAGFKLSYPKAWGLLSCTNSSNIELDPANGADLKVSCSTARKPITILVNDNWGCSGESVKIGNITVNRSKQSDGGYTKYQWCTKTVPMLNITHRVSTNDPASSKTDYSAQIENIIASFFK